MAVLFNLRSIADNAADDTRGIVAATVPSGPVIDTGHESLHALNGFACKDLRPSTACCDAIGVPEVATPAVPASKFICKTVATLYAAAL
jgi:hypothetical protein